MTPLDKTLKRAVTIKGVDYVIALSPESLKITRKGRRIGVELDWAELVSGETALAVALRASVGKLESSDGRERHAAVKPAKQSRSHRPQPRAKPSRRSRDR